MANVYAQSFIFGDKLSAEQVEIIKEKLTQNSKSIGKRFYGREWDLEALLQNTPVGEISNKISDDTFYDVLWDMYGITDTLSLSIQQDIIIFESSRTMLTEEGIRLFINKFEEIIGDKINHIKFEANDLNGDDFAAYSVNNNGEVVYDENRTNKLQKEWDIAFDEEE